MPATDVDELTSILEAMEDLDLKDTVALKEALRQATGLPNPSHALLKKILKRFASKRCLKCPFVGSYDDLVAHLLKNRDHFYGQQNYRIHKREFIRRLQDDLGLYPNLTIDATIDSPLSHAENAAFTDSVTNEHLTRNHCEHRDNIIVESCLLVRLRKGRRSGK